MAEPKPIEVSATVSIGGKIQIVKYEQTSDFHISIGGRWSLPSEWDDNDASSFRTYIYNELRKEIEGLAQKELDELYEARDQLN